MCETDGQRTIDGAARSRRSEVQTVIGAVYVIEDIIDASLNSKEVRGKR